MFPVTLSHDLTFCTIKEQVKFPNVSIPWQTAMICVVVLGQFPQLCAKIIIVVNSSTIWSNWIPCEG